MIQQEFITFLSTIYLIYVILISWERIETITKEKITFNSTRVNYVYEALKK